MAFPPNFKRDYYTSAQVAKLQGIQEKSVRRQRMEERGPPPTYFAGRVFYLKRAFKKWQQAELKNAGRK